jgi:hypothetical protein
MLPPMLSYPNKKYGYEPLHGTEKEMTSVTVYKEQSSVPITENIDGDQNFISSFLDSVDISQHTCFGYTQSLEYCLKWYSMIANFRS